MRVDKLPEECVTFAAAILPSWATLPVSRFVLASNDQVCQSKD